MHKHDAIPCYACERRLHDALDATIDHLLRLVDKAMRDARHAGEDDVEYARR